MTIPAKGYRFEVERIGGPRPWEWRVYFGDELCASVSGSRATAELALHEAMLTMGIDDDPPPLPRHMPKNARLMSPLNNGFNEASTATGGDGVALYSCPHPIGPPSDLEDDD